VLVDWSNGEFSFLCLEAFREEYDFFWFCFASLRAGYGIKSIMTFTILTLAIYSYIPRIFMRRIIILQSYASALLIY